MHVSRRPLTPTDAINFDELAPTVARGFHNDEALTIDYEAEHNDIHRSCLPWLEI